MKNDPYEFHNLAEDPKHASTMKDLQQRLVDWRKQSNDPLLTQENLRRLANEIRSVKSKKASKKRAWEYPEYFFPR